MYNIDVETFLVKNKMTQTGLASFLNLSQTYVSSWVNGRRRMPQKYIQTILDSERFDTSMITIAKTPDTVRVDKDVFELLKNQSETILSQQRTIEVLVSQGEKVARQDEGARCADAG